MAATLLTRNRKATWFAWLAGATLAVVIGEILLLPIGDGLARLSYDVPFPLSSARVPDNLVMVYLDARVKASMGQPSDQPLERRFYAQLLDRLTQHGARLVLFDILFDDPHPDPAVDQQFAAAIRKHGRVVLVGYQVKQFQGNAVTTVVVPPTAILADAAAGWGTGEISHDNADYAVRRLEPGGDEFPSAGWVAASLLGAEITRRPEKRLELRWLNYDCEPDDLKAVNFDHVLVADIENYVRDKIVVVGYRPGSGAAGTEREEFSTPYTRFDGSKASGASIHAFTLLNLLRGDWLMRLGFKTEALLVLLWGILISLLLLSFRPWVAVIVSLVTFALFALAAAYVQARYHFWFAWLVPAAVQTSIATLWSVGFQYLVELRRRQRLRRAFAIHLSPYMADRISESDYDLSPGGKEVEATVMFTDLEGFSQMSETLPPTEVSKLLIAYFTETTRAIFDQDGTIIKYIGDSVMAAWGAPLADPRPAERAVMAAIGVRKAGLKEFHGRRLRTRIGINSGKVLAGNLGSEFRSDWTCIGEATNFASRLEGLNKYLGTDILISESIQRELSEEIQLRKLGRFIVAGTSKPVDVYEVVGDAAELQPPPRWLDVFGEALDRFATGHLDDAERLMRQVVELRGKDGPAEFYLKEISKARLQPVADKLWDGIVSLESK
jgi:adenylate cyclase